MVRPQQGKTGTVKGFKEMKIRILVEKGNKRNGKIEGSNGKSINQIDSSNKGIIPKL